MRTRSASAHILAFASPRPSISEERKRSLREKFSEERAAVSEDLKRIKQVDELDTEKDEELSRMLIDSSRRRLATIDFALDRIREDNYGNCQSCPGLIEEGKLLAMPRSTTCRSCEDKAAHEFVARRSQESVQALDGRGPLFRPPNRN